MAKEGWSLESKEWPHWWDWELEFSPHLLKRMLDRDFTEVDVRRMLEDATAYEPDIKPGRFVIKSSHGGHPWDIIVEPDLAAHLLVVVTAYSPS